MPNTSSRPMVRQGPAISCPRSRRTFLTALLFALLASVAVAQEVSLEAEVDRTTVRFGESLTLTLTLTQAISGGTVRHAGSPDVESIPDFDIAGRRTAQNMTFINGVGRLQVQTSLELVPRGPGDFKIPAMGIKLPDGKTVSSKAIAVKVLPPEDEPAAGQGAAAGSTREEDDTDRIANGGGTSLFKAFTMLLLVVAAVIFLPILLSWYMSRRTASRRAHPDGEAPLRPDAAAAAPERSGVEDAKIVATPKPRALPVDFEREVERLKREVPEASLEFYRTYFDIFHKALVAANPRMSAMQTPDELRRTAAEHFPPAVSDLMNTIVDEWEGVTYARVAPSRPFGALHDDTRSIVRALTHRQEIHR